MCVPVIQARMEETRQFACFLINTGNAIQDGGSGEITKQTGPSIQNDPGAERPAGALTGRNSASGSPWLRERTAKY